MRRGGSAGGFERSPATAAEAVRAEAIAAGWVERTPGKLGEREQVARKTSACSSSWRWPCRCWPSLTSCVCSNFAFSLPAKHKVRGLSKKRLLRKAVEQLLPHEVVHGRKRGFSIPAASWLRGELEPFARETLSPETVRRQGFFQPDAVTRVLDTHVSGREDLSRQLWGLLAFTLWHEHHVEGIHREAPLESIVA